MPETMRAVVFDRPAPDASASGIARVAAVVGSGGLGEVAIARWALCRPVPVGVELSRAAVPRPASSRPTWPRPPISPCSRGARLTVDGAGNPEPGGR